jgi:radical SAM protein with 4Fe4S-binding SPASM domain
MREVGMPDAGQLVPACGALREGDAAELAERLGVIQRRIPIEGLLETTFRCNLRCAHCYVSQPAGSSEAAHDELSLARLTRLMDELADAGCLFLTLSGGEPLLRPDFADLYRHVVRCGIVVSLFTNATLVNDATVDLLDEWRPDYVEVSLYGMRRATYERVTQVAGSFDRCMQGIERLRARGIPLRLKAMALRWNVHELPAMERFADSVEAPFRFDVQLNPRIDCAGSRYRELQLSPAATVELDVCREGRWDEMRRALGPARSGESQEQRSLYGCSAGRTTFTIDARGRLLLCPLLRREGHDLRSGGFAEGWRSLAAAREGGWRSASPCRKCSLMALCDSCPGANELETGDVETPVPVFCAIAHGRAAAILGPQAGHLADATCCLGVSQRRSIA